MEKEYCTKCGFIRYVIGTIIGCPICGASGFYGSPFKKVEKEDD